MAKAEIDESSFEITEGVVQLRFTDSEGGTQSINAIELSEVLEGMAEFTANVTKHGLFGNAFAPEVRVRPPREGSFILEFIVEATQNDPFGALGVAGTAGAAVTKALDVGIRKLRGDKVADFDDLNNGNVKVVWQSGEAVEIPREAWDELQTMKKKTRASLRKIMAPLASSTESLEIREGETGETTDEILDSKPNVVAGLSDYREAAVVVDDVSLPEKRTFTTEANLTSIDFRKGQKWGVQSKEGNRYAHIADEDFLKQVDSGAALRKNDVFDVTIREVSTTKNGRKSREWTITKVVLKHQGGDDEHDEPSETPAEQTD